MRINSGYSHTKSNGIKNRLVVIMSFYIHHRQFVAILSIRLYLMMLLNDKASIISCINTVLHSACFTPS